MTNDERQTFTDFCLPDAPFLRQVKHINDFAIIATIPPIPAGVFGDEELTASLSQKLYDYIRQIVRDAGFHYETELQPFREPAGFGVKYDDDEFQFRAWFADNRVGISRPGSSFEDFHSWYTRFMPVGQSLATTMCQLLGETLHRSLDILSASFRFDFILHDFLMEGARAAVRNPEIMKTIIRVWPGEAGRTTDDAAVLASVARADFAVQRWSTSPISGQRRLERYSVEAPSNQLWSSLWFNFEYRATSYTDPESGIRETVDPVLLLNDYRSAYVDFLRDKALSGFMASLLEGYRFSTTAGTL
ncbi:MAG: hypothetical protein E6J41_10555 [Chloroflexi bacterium]|nr:MAG: hypothetical protein E6J41_10555 [Chloroflexota bacterium]